MNKLARAVTKWTKACDKRLARLIAYIHHTCELRQYCHVGNTAHQCRLGLSQDSDFAETWKTRSQHQEEFFALSEVKRSCQQVGCARNNLMFHTGLRKMKIISLDAGLRMDGIPALDLCDLVVGVFHSSPKQTNKAKAVREPR